MKHGLLGMLICLSVAGFAQEFSGPIIRANYHHVPFSEVVRDLEGRYSLHFFYLEAWTDSLEIDVQLEDVSLTRALARMLDRTGLHFYLPGGGRVILTQGFDVVTDLDPDFAGNGNEETAAALQLFEPIQTGRNNQEAISIENQLFSIGDPQKRLRGRTATLSGYLRDSESGESLTSVSVFTKTPPIVGTITDDFGYYVLTLPKGERELHFTYFGMKDTRRKIELYSDGRLDVSMSERIFSLKEVEVLSERSAVETVQTGSARLNIKEIKTIPTVLGEADVMKIALTLPGVQSVGEGASGFNVRGGNTDQNLVALDEGMVYNPNHLFGFFSAFNPDVIKGAELHKSGVQAHYGGRVSSYFDVGIREGNKKQLAFSGGIGPVTSKLTVEGPIKTDTSSFILGLRSTYSDWILRAIDDPALSNSSGYFGDAIAKVHHQINDKNTLTLSGYHSRDQFRLNSDTLYRYLNTTAGVQWRHLFNSTLSARLSSHITDYAYQVESDANAVNAFELNYRIRHLSTKLDFDYFPQRHHIKFGLQSIYYRLNPGQIAALNPVSVVRNLSLNQENGVEAALYLGDEYEFSDRLTVYAGIRLSGFALLGPGNVFSYLPDLPREKAFLSDTTAYGRGKTMQTYGGPELRLGARFKLSDELSAKLSFDRHRQYIHMLTNSVAIAPTDTWRLSNPYLPPQTGNQVALGLYQNMPNKGLEFSVEGYYKILQNLIEYKDGASLIVNEILETDVLPAAGRAYGVEMLLKKKSGKLNGWVSYTYSRSLLRTLSPFPSEQVNAGQSYPSHFDRPHNLTIITNYKYNWRVNASLNFTYSTGRPATLPLSAYPLAGGILPFFTDRNQYRIPDYYRLDLAINLEGNHKVNKLVHGSWSFSIYNLTGRNNAYSVFARIQNGSIQVYQLSILSQAIPTLTYNFRFR